MPPGRVARQHRLALQRERREQQLDADDAGQALPAALNVDELSVPSKPLQAKKGGLVSNTQPAQRKRAALGDVSNVTKAEVNDGKKAGKSVFASKAARPSGIQKNTARPSSRPALGSKEANKKVEPKQSGAGAIGAAVPKRKVSSATSSAREDTAAEEPLRKKIHTLEADKQPAKVGTVKKEEAITSKLVAAAAEPEADKFEYPEGVKDLDTEDLDDPLMVAEYANEIFVYLQELEVKSAPNPQYMSHQDDLDWKTRGILVDWLIEVHTRFHLLPETLFLAVNIIDRFLSEKVVQLDRLQLVGITAMFIASKYEEVLSPHVANFRHVADDGFSESEILSAERFILQTLNYDLGYPNPMNFLRRISKADNYDIQSRTVGKYLTEISLLDHRFMAYRPSHVAAAAMYLARLILDRGEWDETLTFYAGYSEEEIEPVFQLMVDYLARPLIHEAFFKKYASKKFLKASLLTRQWAKKHAALFGITDTDTPIDQLS